MWIWLEWVLDEHVADQLAVGEIFGQDPPAAGPPRRLDHQRVPQGGVNALVLDAGAFLAAERADRALMARLRVAQRQGVELRSNAIVVSQVWRDSRGCQASLARLLRGVDIRPVDDAAGRAAGVLIGRAGTQDPIDATLVLLARAGDRILTSDPQDIHRLLSAAGRVIEVVVC